MRTIPILLVLLLASCTAGSSYPRFYQSYPQYSLGIPFQAVDEQGNTYFVPGSPYRARMAARAYSYGYPSHRPTSSIKGAWWPQHHRK